MEEEVVCPLCCEELDISDRQFFPCKCGYQVCMWCWHRIRESESGLCPACRTPYGDDPHEFSAVDVEDVLKANKEKEAAAKKERDRQRHQSDGGYVSEVEGLAGGRQVGQMEIPKDRTQLANMRVIRRNLVYAVGLPPNVASEDQLRKSEYFGQYGKIAKIVLNRSQTTAGSEARRASASAYVTLVHKEDTLACILALDGFYMDGRNVRSSYGTSKYCSAFIKNVRCNNPECTYLHNMGHIEDTFTKQEIQAGYVTSGRDVLARQQQIVQQALSAASGAAGSTPRRRTGGGGPSGTGKASSNPVFPPPSYDEPAKSSAASLVPTPPTITQVRSAGPSASAATSGPGFPSISTAPSASASSSTTTMNAANRVTSAAGSTSTGTLSTAPKAVAASLPIPQTNRKSMAASVSSSNSGSKPAGATAASVVAGVHSVSNHSEPPAPHTTLTPLTPLKRTGASKGSQKSNGPEMQKLTNTRAGVSKKLGLKSGSQVGSPNAEARSTSNRNHLGISGIGGDVISAPVAVPQPIIGNQINPLAAANGISRGQQSSGPSSLSHFGGNGLGGLGGEVFDGPLLSSSNIRSAIGSGKGKWDSIPGGDAGYSVNNNTAPSWGNVSQNTAQNDTIGGGVIGGGMIGGGNAQRSGSSALASMLGINLPTGSGSLRESSSQLWTTELSNQNPGSSLNGSSLPLQGVIGGTNNHLIGGVPIGGRNHQIPTTANGGNNSDIALLQSLLPGVHITSGGNFNGSGFGSIGSSNNNSALGSSQRTGGGSASLASEDSRQGFGLQQSLGGQPIGTIGQGQAHGKQRQAPGSIW